MKQLNKNNIYNEFCGINGKLVSPKLHWNRMKKNNPDAYEFMINYFSDVTEEDKPIEVLYRIVNGIYEKPVCAVCGKPVQFTRWGDGYQLCCSPECRKSPAGSAAKQKQAEKILQEKYGVNCPSKIEGFEEKCKKSCIEKYGVYSASLLKETQNKRKKTNLEKYGVEEVLQSKEIKDKSRKTCIEKYGVEYASQNSDIKKKSEETCLERYGVKSILSNKEIRNKIKQTNLERYGTEIYTNSDDFKKKKDIAYSKYPNNHPMYDENVKKKSEETCLEKYGVPYSFQSENNKEKSKQTNWEKYGCENPMQNEDVKKKLQDTCIERYGVPYYTQTDEYKERSKQTCLEKFGVPYSFQSENNKIKTKQTNLERYGVKYPMQNKEVNDRHFESKKKNGTTNTSKIETDFADWLTENNYNFIREYKSDLYPYHCDFYLPDFDLYIEIQGNWTHGHHLFNPENIEDLLIVEQWKAKNTDYYNAAIDVWTIRDPEKRRTAEINNLNYLEIFTNDSETAVSELKKWLNTI